MADQIERDYGIVGDRTCSDWTRLYRLPRVVRDGVAVAPELEIGDPARLGPWRRPFAPAPTTIPAASRGDVDFGAASPKVIAAARARLARHGPAIQGQGGDAHTRAAWGILTHNFALDDTAARALLLAWNATCRPPWTEAELFGGPARADQSWNGEYGEARDAVLVGETLAKLPRDEQIAAVLTRVTPTSRARTLKDENIRTFVDTFLDGLQGEP